MTIYLHGIVVLLIVLVFLVYRLTLQLQRQDEQVQLVRRLLIAWAVTWGDDVQSVRVAVLAALTGASWDDTWMQQQLEGSDHDGSPDRSRPD